jgi:cytochrome c oxidase subunit 3
MPVFTEQKRTGDIIAPPRWRDPFGGGDDRGGGEGSSFPVSKAQLATWMTLTGIAMLFAGLTSAFVVLHGSPGWQNIKIPPLLWGNTLVLIASSVTLEISRRAVKQNRQSDLTVWLVLSGILGIAFLAGQFEAWRQLVQAGVYLPTTLHSSFFYVLTGIHGVHILGGLIVLAYVLQCALRGRLRPAAYEPLKLGVLYWHFMDAVWIYLFLLLLSA